MYASIPYNNNLWFLLRWTAWKQKGIKIDRQRTSERGDEERLEGLIIKWIK